MKLTDEQVRESYPGAIESITAMEHTSPINWDAVRSDNISPNELRDGFRFVVIQGFLEKHPTAASVSPKQAAQMITILDQIDHSDFLKYLNAKLGGI